MRTRAQHAEEMREWRKAHRPGWEIVFVKVARRRLDPDLFADLVQEASQERKE